jgi:hypothetical protein
MPSPSLIQHLQDQQHCSTFIADKATLNIHRSINILSPNIMSIFQYLFIFCSAMVAEFKQLSFLNNHNAIQDQTTSGKIAPCTMLQYN